MRSTFSRQKTDVLSLHFCFFPCWQ